jgi:hypothetical protein
MAARKATRPAGLRPFRGVLRDVKELWAWAAGAATVPFLANLVSLAPPWPPAIVYLTAIIELIALIFAFHFLKASPAHTINRVLVASLVLLMLSSLVYLALLSEFTFNIPGQTTASTKGFVCTAEAVAVYAEKCPWLGENELKQAEWFAPHLWTSWSITIARLALCATWLLAFMMLSMLLGSFVVHQRHRTR